MITKYYGDRIEITGTPDEMADIPFADHGREVTVTMRNDWGGCFALAAKMEDVQLVNEDADVEEPKKGKEKKPRAPKITKAKKEMIRIQREQGLDDDAIAANLSLDIKQVKRVK